MPNSEPAIVNPLLLVWARTAGRFQTGDAAKKLGVSEDRLLDWESGARSPSIAQLRKMAEVYKRPLAVFFLPEPPKTFDAMRDFRRLPDSELGYSPALALEIRRAQMRRDIVLELFHDMEKPVPRFEDVVPPGTDAPDDLAVTARHLLGIDLSEQFGFKDEYAALNRWTGAVEHLGVLVFHAPRIELSEMRGFSLYNAIVPVIVLNAKDSPRGRLFTLLHEFAHLLLRADGLCDRHDAPGQEGSDPEVFSNRVAAVTLVPEAALLADPTVQTLHRSEIDDTDTQRIARRFSVSREVVLRRLLTVGKISLAYYRKKRDEYLKAYGRETQQGSPPYHILVVRNLGKEFVRTVLDAYRQELITSAALSEFLGVKLKTVPRIEEAALHHEGSGTS